MSLFDELKRRNVIRVGIAYVVVAWLIAQVADLVFDNVSAPEWIMPVLLFLLAAGFVVALFFAWAFEMTPEGIKKEKDVDRSQSITHKTGRKLDFTIIGILVLALGYFVWESRFEQDTILPTSAVDTVTPADTTSQDQSPSGFEASIAVLPFVNMSADADNEYFSDGISEELLNVLVKVSSLRVASRTSAFAYKGKKIPMSQIASELSVGHILEGSVRKVGNTVRITAQLIDAKTDTHLWSETYQRELVDIFDIQEEISNSIVDALKVALNVDDAEALHRAQRPTDNAEAYELYLQGRHQWRTRQVENLHNAIELFKRAIELDPGFARAYEGQASVYAVLSFWSDMSRAEADSYLTPLARKALELDPTLAEARADLAESYGDRHEWAKMLNEFSLAIEYEPRNATVHQWYGEVLANMGYLSQALIEIRAAYELDPASPVINNVLGYIAARNDEEDLALKHYGIARRMGINLSGAAIIMHIRLGEYDAAREVLSHHEAVPPYAETCIKAVGDPALIPKLQTLLAQSSTETDLFVLNHFCHALAGDIDQSLAIIMAQLDDSWTAMQPLWGKHQYASAYRLSPQFRTLLKDIGLVDFYRTNGWPDLCRPLGEEDFECD